VSGSGGGGGALYLQGGQVQLTNSTFESNSAADGSRGGAVAVVGGSLSSSECHFVGNEVSGSGHSGGALYVQSPGQVQLTNSTFESNTAADGSYGGAVAVLSGLLSITRCHFEQNSAPSGSGGAIWWQFDNWVALCDIVASSTFTGNHAGEAGGALFVQDANTPPPECIQQAMQSMQQHNNIARGYGNTMASSPSSVQMISVQGSSHLPTQTTPVDVYPAQPLSFVVSVYDVFHQPCVQSPRINLAITTPPDVQLIWAHNSKLNATGFANMAKSNAIRLLQANHTPFVMNFSSTDSTLPASVYFRPVSCPAG
jgi:hypothetical protein